MIIIDESLREDELFQSLKSKGDNNPNYNKWRIDNNSMWYAILSILKSDNVGHIKNIISDIEGLVASRRSYKHFYTILLEYSIRYAKFNLARWIYTYKSGESFAIMTQLRRITERDEITDNNILYHRLYNEIDIRYVKYLVSPTMVDVLVENIDELARIKSYIDDKDLEAFRDSFALTNHKFVAAYLVGLSLDSSLISYLKDVDYSNLPVIMGMADRSSLRMDLITTDEERAYVRRALIINKSYSLFFNNFEGVEANNTILAYGSDEMIGLYVHENLRTYGLNPIAYDSYMRKYRNSEYMEIKKDIAVLKGSIGNNLLEYLNSMSEDNRYRAYIYNLDTELMRLSYSDNSKYIVLRAIYELKDNNRNSLHEEARSTLDNYFGAELVNELFPKYAAKGTEEYSIPWKITLIFLLMIILYFAMLFVVSIITIIKIGRFLKDNGYIK